MVYAINGTGGPTQFCSLIPGMSGWQCTSDRDVKENFVPADAGDILRKLVAMPLYSWNFKGADPEIRSLGPTAQDFNTAFGYGNDDKTIGSTNLHGVALAAIQGLYQIVQGKDARIAALEAKVDAQQKAFAELHRSIEVLLARGSLDAQLAQR